MNKPCINNIITFIRDSVKHLETTIVKTLDGFVGWPLHTLSVCARVVSVAYVTNDNTYSVMASMYNGLDE